MTPRNEAVVGYLKGCGSTYAEIARTTGLNRTTVARIVQGKQSPSAATLRHLGLGDTVPETSPNAATPQNPVTLTLTYDEVTKLPLKGLPVLELSEPSTVVITVQCWGKQRSQIATAKPG